MVTASKTSYSTNVDGDDEPASLPKPDLSQMVPFKPKYKSIPGDHPVSGMWFTFLLALCSLVFLI